MPLIIRTATMSDVTALLALWEIAAENASRAPDTSEAVTAMIEPDPDAVILAEQDGELVGSVIAGWDGWRGRLYRLALMMIIRAARYLFSLGLQVDSGRLVRAVVLMFAGYIAALALLFALQARAYG